MILSDGFDGTIDELTSSDVNALITATEGKDSSFPDELHQTYNSEMAPFAPGSWGFWWLPWNFYNGWELPIHWFLTTGTSGADNFVAQNYRVWPSGTTILFLRRRTNFVGGGQRHTRSTAWFYDGFDGGYSGKDVFRPQVYYITTHLGCHVEGRHLWAYDELTKVLSLSTSCPASEIESSNSDGTYTRPNIEHLCGKVWVMFGVVWIMARIIRAQLVLQKWHEQYYASQMTTAGMVWPTNSQKWCEITATVVIQVYVHTEADNVTKFSTIDTPTMFLGQLDCKCPIGGGYDTATGERLWRLPCWWFHALGYKLGRPAGIWFCRASAKGHWLRVWRTLERWRFWADQCLANLFNYWNGYTKIWAQTQWGEYHPLKLVGEFDTGVVFARGRSVT